MKKRITGTLIVLLAFGLGYSYYMKEKMADRCINYSPAWVSMIDCYGVISIWNDDNVFYLQNTTKPGLIIAQIKNPNNFIVKNNYMYIMDSTPRIQCNNLMPGKYCGDFQANGEMKRYYYDNPEDVPKYIVINIINGDSIYYQKIEEAPETDRLVFEELSRLF